MYFQGDRVLRSFRGASTVAWPEDLLKDLVGRGLVAPFRWLVPTEYPIEGNEPGASWLETSRVPVWSYPYEWCRPQLCDAGLLTLAILREAITRGWTLKDASPFNVQFEGAVPLFVDLNSFEPRSSEGPWLAYRQFCREFIAPAAVGFHLSDEWRRLLTRTPDGLDLDACSRALPLSSLLDLGAFFHVLLPAFFERRVRFPGRDASRLRLATSRLLAIVGSLEEALRRWRLPRRVSPWAGYSDDPRSYSKPGLAAKEAVLRSHLARVGKIGLALDLGCNTGRFTRLIMAHAARVVAIDSDDASIAVLYESLASERNRAVLPLCFDFVAPAPALGWRCAERESFDARVRPDLVSALALVHHVCAGRGIPLREFLGYLASLAPRVILEWVPPEDPMARPLLDRIPGAASRYTAGIFEAELSANFEVETRSELPGSSRVMFLLRSR